MSDLWVGFLIVVGAGAVAGLRRRGKAAAAAQWRRRQRELYAAKDRESEQYSGQIVEIGGHRVGTRGLRR